MTYHQHTSLQVTRDAPPPAVELSGQAGDIPLVEFSSAYNSRVQIHLGLHDDPERWLRDTAERLVALAEMVAVQRGRDAA